MVFVPVVPDRPDTRADLKDLKKKWKIGIFGSYTNANKTQLSRLQIFLKANDYSETFLATDLEELFPKQTGETETAYNHRISNKLVTHCHIHLFVIFHARPDELGTNMSVLGELQETRRLKKKKILLYYQMGTQNEIGNYFKTYLVDCNYEWEPSAFKNELKEKHDKILGQLYDMCWGILPNPK